MSFSDTPNKLEAVFVQRNTTNVRYDQINISGSDLIVYLDENGKINADKVSTWASKYGIGIASGSAATASWASQSLFAFTSSFATRSLFASWASQSLSSSWAAFALNALSASYAISSSTAQTASYSLSASYGSTSSFAVSASYAPGSPSVSASYALTASYVLNGGGGGTSSLASTASIGMLAEDTNLWGNVPYFVSESGHMSASKIGIAHDGTVKVYATTLTTPPMQKVFYIGKDGNANTWATLGFYNDAGGLNSKYWLQYADNANTMEFSAVQDDFSIINPWLTVTRSGSAISQILFQKATTINGNLLPLATLSHSLGTSSLQWKNAWIVNMIGTASVAITALTASSLSFVPQTTISASWASASISASYAPGNPSISASFSTTASYAINSSTASLLLGSVESATFAVSSSWASSSLSSSFTVSASFATTASHAFTSLRTISASFASASISASYVGTVLSASYSSASLSASYAPGNPSISSSFATTASYAFTSVTSSFTLGNISSANQAISASWASSSLSSSVSNTSTTASYALTASMVIGSITDASQAISASFASSSLSSSIAVSSSYPWSASAQGNPYHNIKAVGIGTLAPPASRFSILEPTSNSISQSIATIMGYRDDLTTMSLEIRNLSATSSNSTAGLRLGLGTGLEGGIIFVARTATPAFGIVNGLNISTTAGSTDIGIRAGLALSGSVAGPHVQVKSNGTIGMGVASPVNARLHIGGTDLAFYNATLRMTNGSAGGADVFFAATDDAWGGSISGKLLIGTGDPSGGTQILQLYPTSASVGVGIASNVSPQAKLHVQGNISASSVTASVFGTASWAENVITSSFAVSASWAPAVASTTAVSASWASSSLSSSYSLVASSASYASTSTSASYASASATSSYSNFATSASYAPSAPSISASYALTASYAANAGGTAASSRAMVLCAAFTPFLTGADYAEIPVPYLNDGVTAVSWSVNRINFRVNISGSTTSSITIQKSAATGIFTPTYVTAMSLNSSSYQTFTGSLVGVVSGDKVRFSVDTIGTAQYWTITTEISSL